MPILNPIADTIKYRYSPVDCVERFDSYLFFETETKGRIIENFYHDYFESIDYKRNYRGGSVFYSKGDYSNTFIIHIQEKDLVNDIRKVTIRYRG